MILVPSEKQLKRERERLGAIRLRMEAEAEEKKKKKGRFWLAFVKAFEGRPNSATRSIEK